MIATIPTTAIPVEVIRAKTPDNEKPHSLTLTRYQYYIGSGNFEYVTVYRDGVRVYAKRYSGSRLPQAAKFMADSRADLGDWITN